MYKKIWNSYKFPIILLISIIIGSILGSILGPEAKIFKPFGDIFINAMFTLVVPLVFSTITSAISNMTNMKRLGKIVSVMIILFIISSIVVSIITIILVKIFPPAENVNILINQVKDINPPTLSEQIVSSITVTDFTELISKKHILPLIIFSILFGFSINVIGKSGEIVSNFLNGLSKALLKMVNLVMYYAPIGLGAYFANLVGEYGNQLVGSYARSIIFYYLLTIMYILVFYPLYAYISGGKLALKSLKNLVSPIITSLATQSSLATVPVNLEASEEIGVSKDVADIVIPVGATAHMEGSVIGAVLKISFLFGVYNLPFSGMNVYITALFLSIATGVVMSGIPGGGLIGEILIITLYGFPIESLPIIATIGYLIDPPATLLNATGDVLSAMLVTRIIEGKNWLLSKKDK